MEAIARSQMQETMRTGIMALYNMCRLDKKMTATTNLHKRVSIRQEKRAIYKSILDLDKNLETLTAQLRTPSTSIETLVTHNLRKSKNKHINAIREVKTLNGAEKETKEKEILKLAKEIKSLSNMLIQLKAERCVNAN